jgi:hypothetical protein
MAGSALNDASGSPSPKLPWYDWLSGAHKVYMFGYKLAQCNSDSSVSFSSAYIYCETLARYFASELACKCCLRYGSKSLKTAFMVFVSSVFIFGSFGFFSEKSCSVIVPHSG